MYDLRPLLDAVVRGRMAGPLQLSGVASTLEVIMTMFTMLEQLDVAPHWQMSMQVQKSKFFRAV